MVQRTPLTVVTSVTVAPGCIICGECEKICPEVFSVRLSSSVVRTNAERYYRSLAPSILRAAAACPAKVILVQQGPPPLPRQD